MLDGSAYEFYHGYIEGKKESSLAGITIRGEEVDVLISDESGDFQINRFSSKHYVGFYTNELEKQKEFMCESANLPEIPYKEKTSNRRSPSNGCVDIYFEADYSAYTKNGASIINTTDWALNLFNQVALQFNKVGVPIRISELLIHTTSDPYVSFASSSDVLYEFRRIKSNEGFNGRLAHFLSGRGLGGGVAFLNSLCSTFSNYAVSGNLSGNVVSYPNYSWNVMVISQELGHNFGSPHTQSCSWNGNNTAIDGCVDSGFKS